jgi:hypothetical protein
MKFFISLLLTAVVSFAACLFLPWWSIAVAAFVVAAVIPITPAKNFLAGFLALFLLWGGLSLWISNANGHLLAHKISLVLLKMDNPLLLVFITAFIGALVGGLGAWSGSLLRRIKQ